MSDKNIPFIHNYCDRWCERCAFTARCAVFEQLSNENEPRASDIQSELFWERLADNLSKARTMLERSAKEMGIDLEKIEEEMARKDEPNEQKAGSKPQHPLTELAMEYLTIADQWLATQPGMLQKLEEMKEGLSMGVQPPSEAKEQVAMIRDCVDIIRWYSTMIAPKVGRALNGKENRATLDPQSDANGSAKIAIICIDRSMQAWSQLFGLLPEQEDQFLQSLAILEKLKRLMLDEFPRAMDFVRPGFDE